MNKPLRMLSIAMAALIAVIASGIVLIFNLNNQKVSAIEDGTTFSSSAFGSFINSVYSTGKGLLPLDEYTHPWNGQYFDNGEWKDMLYGARVGGTQVIVDLSQEHGANDGEMYAPGIRTSSSSTEMRISATPEYPVASVFTAPADGTYSFGNVEIVYKDPGSAAKQTFSILINDTVKFSKVLDSADTSTKISNLSSISENNFNGSSFQLKKGDKLRLAVYDNLGATIENNKQRGISVNSEIKYLSNVYDEEPTIPAINTSLLFTGATSTSGGNLNLADGGVRNLENANDITTMGGSYNGAWLKFDNMDFGEYGAKSISVRYSSRNSCSPDAAIDIYLGSISGEKVGTIKLPIKADNWSSWQTAYADLDKTITGEQDICFVLRGDTEKAYVANLFYFNFMDSSTTSKNPYTKTYFAFTDDAGQTVDTEPGRIPTGESSELGLVVKATNDGHWYKYSGLDFGTNGADKIFIKYDTGDSTKGDTKAVVMLGSAGGEVIGTVNLSKREQGGVSWGDPRYATVELSKVVTGTQDIYIKLTGTEAGKGNCGNLYDFYFAEAEPAPSIIGEKIEFQARSSWDTTHPVPITGKDGLKTENSTVFGESVTTIGGTHDGAWIKFDGLNFGSEGAGKMQITYSGNSGNCAEDARIEIREGDASGTLLGTVNLPPTAGGWGTWVTVAGNLDSTIAGTKDICFVLKGTTQKTEGVTNGKFYVANLYSFTFEAPNASDPVDVAKSLIDAIGTVELTGDCLAKIKAAEEAYRALDSEQQALIDNYDVMVEARFAYDLLEIGTNTTDGYGKVEFEKDFAVPGNNSGGALKTENLPEAAGPGQNIGGSYNDAWLKYTGLKFDGDGAKSISVRYVNNSTRCASDARLEIRLGSISGPLMGTIALPSTGTDWNTYAVASADLDESIVGTYNVYLVMKGSTGTNPYIANLDYFQFAQSGNQEAADAVIAAIDAIGTVEFTSYSLKKIEFAEGLYAELNDSAKKLVKNYNVLVEARKEYEKLKTANEGGRDPYSGTGINAATADRDSGFTLKTESVSVNGVVTNVVTGTYFNTILEFDTIAFGADGAKSVSVTYSANSSLCPSNSVLEVYLGSVDGEKIAEVKLSQTASNWNVYNTVTQDLSRVVTGGRDIVVRLVGYTTQAQPQVANIANIKFNSATNTDALNSVKAEETVKLINDIGLVMFDEDSKALIDAARASYDALDAAQKELVRNYRSLLKAEEMYDGLGELQ